MAKNKDLLLVVDANNRAHAAYHAYKRLSYKGKPVSVIYGLPSMIKSLIWQHKPDKVVLVWDGKKSIHRLKVHPNYKGHRIKKAPSYNFDVEDFLRQKAEVQKLFYYLGVPQVLNPEQEADDMIYKIVKNGKKHYKEVMIVSGDKDFHQLLEGRKVTIWNDAKKDEINQTNIKDYFGYHAEECVDWLTLVGDDSDDIPGYPGMGPKYTRDFLDKYKSLESYLDSGDQFRSLDRQLLLEVKKKNALMIDLALFYRKFRKELKIKFYQGNSTPPVNKEKFRALATKYNMQKLLAKDFTDEFIDLKLKQE